MVMQNNGRAPAARMAGAQARCGGQAWNCSRHALCGLMWAPYVFFPGAVLVYQTVKHVGAYVRLHAAACVALNMQLPAARQHIGMGGCKFGSGNVLFVTKRAEIVVSEQKESYFDGLS
ncbi:hypothetical protein [Comamonas sp. 4034]|uniref:hypothetical protein n=1 Tax=Comamonas sp. 4034 TaxID=3156455 RepID=UPI003D19B197